MFSYFGVMMNETGICEKSHIENQCCKTLASIPLFSFVGMNGYGLETVTKVQLYKSFISSRMEYGVWPKWFEPDSKGHQ